jgi:hypothetical protein
MAWRLLGGPASIAGAVRLRSLAASARQYKPRVAGKAVIP